MKPLERLAQARAAVAALDRATERRCAVLGHDMRMAGGANCGCEDGACSVPVYACTRCGDCDYGDNPEAEEIRANCEKDT